MQDWWEIYKVYFSMVPECRRWFANHVFCERSSRLTEYLLDSTSAEVLFINYVTYVELEVPISGGLKDEVDP